MASAPMTDPAVDAAERRFPLTAGVALVGSAGVLGATCGADPLLGALVVAGGRAGGAGNPSGRPAAGCDVVDVCDAEAA